MKTRRRTDSPWHRLPITLPTAMLVWAVALWGLGYFIAKPIHQPPEPPAIDARLIEESVPAEIRSDKPERPAAVHRPKPLPPVRPQPVPVAPPASPKIVQDPAAQKPEATTNTAVPAPVLAAPAAPGGTGTAPSEGHAAAEGNASANSGAQTGSNDTKGSSHGSMYANSGARVLDPPKLQIPDDMREEAFNYTVTARFHVAADGSAKVELIKPTPNPRLNRFLLDSLRKKYHFFPAIKNGMPVASTVDIDVKMEVR